MKHLISMSSIAFDAFGKIMHWYMKNVTRKVTKSKDDGERRQVREDSKREKGKIKERD